MRQPAPGSPSPPPASPASRSRTSRTRTWSREVRRPWCGAAGRGAQLSGSSRERRADPSEGLTARCSGACRPPAVSAPLVRGTRAAPHFLLLSPCCQLPPSLLPPRGKGSEEHLAVMLALSPNSLEPFPGSVDFTINPGLRVAPGGPGGPGRVRGNGQGPWSGHWTYGAYSPPRLDRKITVSRCTF